MASFYLYHSLIYSQFSSVLFSHSVLPDSLQPHGPQQARPPCPSPTPGVYPNWCPLSWWCYPIILSSVISFSPCPVFPRIRIFSNELALRIRWPKYWSFSFSISPSSEYSGLISFRIDCFARSLGSLKKHWTWSLEKEMATHSSILTWIIPWTEEPGGLQFIGSQRVRHEWATNTFTFWSPETRFQFPEAVWLQARRALPVSEFPFF